MSNKKVNLYKPLKILNNCIEDINNFKQLIDNNNKIIVDMEYKKVIVYLRKDKKEIEEYKYNIKTLKNNNEHYRKCIKEIKDKQYKIKERFKLQNFLKMQDEIKYYATDGRGFESMRNILLNYKDCFDKDKTTREDARFMRLDNARLRPNRYII